MDRANAIANDLTKAERTFILSAPGKAAVPDRIWFGTHCDLIEFNGNGWRKSAMCAEVISILKSSD